MYSASFPERRQDSDIRKDDLDSSEEEEQDEDDLGNTDAVECFQSLVIPPRRVWKSGMHND